MVIVCLTMAFRLVTSRQGPLVVRLLLLGSRISRLPSLPEWALVVRRIVLELPLVLDLVTGLPIGVSETCLVSVPLEWALNRYVLSREPLLRWPVLRMDMYVYLLVVNRFLMIPCLLPR